MITWAVTRSRNRSRCCERRARSGLPSSDNNLSRCAPATSPLMTARTQPCCPRDSDAGSVSQPGRRLPTYHATWVGACPEIHYPHRADRLAPGSLDFVEVPLTSDHNSTDHWTGVGDIRFEDADEDYITYVCRKEVARQLDEGVLLPHLCLFTHNLYDYSSEERGQGHLRPTSGCVVIERLQAIGDAVGVEITGATIADASNRFRTLSSPS